jgi:hypothetical protein
MKNSMEERFTKKRPIIREDRRRRKGKEKRKKEREKKKESEIRERTKDREDEELFHRRKHREGRYDQ